MCKIYLDTNIWSRAFDHPSSRIIAETNAFFKILEVVFEGRLTIVGSVALEVEVGQIKNQEKRAAAEKLMVSSISGIVYDISAMKSKEIKQTIKLRLPDATHIACAIKGKCEYFISCDDEIIKKGKKIEKHYGIKVYNPVEFIKIEGEKWQQGQKK